MKFKKAFTLIELLVVIAIIGILASVVVVNVGSARKKAKNSAIISQLESLKTQAALYYDSNGNYSNLLDDTDVKKIYYGALNSSKGATPAEDAQGTTGRFANSNAQTWVAFIRLASLDSKAHFYCVDSAGASEDVNKGSAGDANVYINGATAADGTGNATDGFHCPTETNL